MSRNKLITIAISLPFVFIFLLLISVFVPKYLFQPEYDYIYYVGNQYNYSNYYEIDDKNIIKKESDNRIKDEKDKGDLKDSVLYVHDVDENKSKKINLEKANEYDIISTSRTSPDGFEFTQYSSSVGFFPFYRNYDNEYVLKGKGASFSQNLEGDHHEINFLGWVE